MRRVQKQSGNSGKKKGRILWIAAAVLLSLVLAFVADYLLYTGSDHVKTVGEESPVFTDGQETFAISDCVIANNEIIVMGVDPQFCVMAPENEVSEVHVLFGEPLRQNTPFQVYYALPGENFSEESSVRMTFAEGSEEEFIAIPAARYSRFRFDIDADVVVREILSGDVARIDLAYSPYAVRIIFFTLEVLLVLGAVYFCFPKKNKDNGSAARAESVLAQGARVQGPRRRRADSKGPRRRRAEPERKGIAAFAWKKPLAAVVLCNLFLSMTVVFFQPLTYGLVNLVGFPFDGLWWGQLLIALGIALVLSVLMLLLPARGGRIAAAVSLGAGIAFLAQALLLNDGRPLQMNTNWPMEMLNIFVWFGIVILAAAMTAYYAGSEGKKAEKAMCLIACVLLAVQAMSFTVLSTSKDEGYRRPEYNPQEIISGETGFAELMNLSLVRGLPFFLKPYSICTSAYPTVDSRSKTPTVLASESTWTSQTSYRR